MAVVFDNARRFDATVPVVIVGAGACGLISALAATEAGADVLVLERDRVPAGSTALSSGFIPAAGTRHQRDAGVADTPAQFAADVLRKNRGEADPRIVATICAAAGPAIEWLADRCAVPFVLIEGFLYPGHSVPRMHSLPDKTGQALMAALTAACARAGVDILSEAQVTTLHADLQRRIRGVSFGRPDGTVEDIGCDALVLACSGFGGNPAMVASEIPELADAPYFGHSGNRGDAIAWGRALGAAVADMAAYQGHGSVATPHGILITWALMTEGGIQVNAQGRRFSNEHDGYSEQCARVLAQPGRCAWNVYDARLHQLGLAFPDYRDAVAAGAIRSAATVESLAQVLGLPAAVLPETIASTMRFAAGTASDPFGRDFTTKPALHPPYHAVTVTGALFHTQGGLAVDANARVCNASGVPLPNLCAGGGAARGVSGSHDSGYLSGNGLLSAVALGRIAGRTSAGLASRIA